MDFLLIKHLLMKKKIKIKIANQKIIKVETSQNVLKNPYFILNDVSDVFFWSVFRL